MTKSPVAATLLTTKKQFPHRQTMGKLFSSQTILLHQMFLFFCILADNAQDRRF